MSLQDSSTPTNDAKHIDQILTAAAQHDIPKLRGFLAEYKFPDCESVDVQDSKGASPLHATIAACSSEKKPEINGESSVDTTEDIASETVRFLLEEGAIWNQLDDSNETPGCIAYRLGLQDVYQLMVDAGVRAEILLNRLEGYEKLNDDDEGEEVAEDVVNETKQAENTETTDINLGSMRQPTDASDSNVNSAEYLSSSLILTRDKLLDGQQNGVMMEWESDIMKRSVDALLDRPGLKILNIGAGMMIFDSFVQAARNKPTSHHIVEAHPDVLARMEEQGWKQKPGVVVHDGKWQDVLPRLVEENETFDAIFYDTFAESYSDFREFFTEQALGLLNPDGKWSFFNGMGADRQISYDVYQKVVEMDMFEAGFDVEWNTMDVPVLNNEWEGVKRKYWNIDQYRLPICKFMD